jgi:hypothetical protein
MGIMSPAYDISFECKADLEAWRDALIVAGMEFDSDAAPYCLTEIERELTRIRNQENALDFLV